MWEVLSKFESVELVLILGLIVAILAIGILSITTVRRTMECARQKDELIQMHGELIALRAEVFALETLTNTLKRVVRRLENAKTYPG